MNEMIERVARALVGELENQQIGTESPWHDPEFRESVFRAARVMIEAMREPTEDMCEAGAYYYHDNYQPGQAKEQTAMPDIWRAMIDEALKSS